MNAFKDRLQDLISGLGYSALETMVGLKVKIVDQKFGKIFVGTVGSVEFRPIEPRSNMGVDSVRFVINGVPHESGAPIIELHLGAPGKDNIWKVAFGNFENAEDLQISFH